MFFKSPFLLLSDSNAYRQQIWPVTACKRGRLKGQPGTTTANVSSPVYNKHRLIVHSVMLSAHWFMVVIQVRQSDESDPFREKTVQLLDDFKISGVNGTRILSFVRPSHLVRLSDVCWQRHKFELSSICDSPLTISV